jgi:hypothetical protein
VVLVAVTNDAEHVKVAFEINVYAGPRHAYLILLLKRITIAACCSKPLLAEPMLLPSCKHLSLRSEVSQLNSAVCCVSILVGN